MQILTTIALIIIGVLLFELIIFSHELGHFITAKKSGVKVNEFALGMGPKLFGFTKGETTYSLRLFPIGGFCAMEGEDEDSEEPRAFNNAKIWKRMIIIIAGAVMNILLGLVLMFVFVVQADVYSSTTVSSFSPNSNSATSGLQVGDRITEVNGYSVWNVKDLEFGVATTKCIDVDGTTLEVYKQDCTNTVAKIYTSLLEEQKPDDETIEKLYEVVEKGCEKIQVSKSKEDAYSLLEDTAKDMYGIFKITDYEIPEIEEQKTRKRYTSDMEVVRNGEKVVLEDVQFFTYWASEENRKAGKTSVSIDFYVEPIEKNIGSVLTQTFSQTCSMVKNVWTSLAWTVQGRFSFNDLSGPVGITSVVSQVASQGLKTGFADAVNNILYVMILITVNLGIVNMLPFPALDGGRFVFLLIEWIFRKPIPRKVEQYVNVAGIIILFLFMIAVSLKDVWQLITGTMPKL